MCQTESRESKRRGLIFLVLVLVGATIYYFFIAQGSPVMTFSREERSFAFTGPKHTSVSFSFDELEALEFYHPETPDWGEPVEGSGGEVAGGNRYGTWRSESLGEYEAFLTTRVPAGILVRDGEKTAAFNTENLETTESLYQQMEAFWEGTLK